jgi:hypothetical protein
VAGTKLELSIPFDGDPECFSTQPSRSTFNPPRADIKGQFLIWTTAAVTPDAGQIKHQFDEFVASVEGYLVTVRADLTTWNAALPSVARDAILKRREKLLADRGVDAALAFPVTARSSPSVYTVPARRRNPVPIPPRSSQPFAPEPVLDAAAYEEVLRLLAAMRESFERNPSTFARLSEEELRDHLLLMLNTQFEGAAAGELFNGVGKTDILVRERNRNIFIGECKFWTGVSDFASAIDQLFGYVVWRDTKAALVLFIRQKDVGAVVDKAVAALQAHPQYKRQLAGGQPTDRQDFVFHAKGDTSREIHLALLPFVVPPKPPVTVPSGVSA